MDLARFGATFHRVDGSRQERLSLDSSVADEQATNWSAPSTVSAMKPPAGAFQSPERFGWPSLRENYLYTLYPEVFGTSPSPELCLEALEHPDIVQVWRLVDREGEPRDYKVEKRLLEHAIFRDAERREPDWRSRVDYEPVKRCVENVLEPSYVLNGLDLRSGPGGDMVRHGD